MCSTKGKISKSYIICFGLTFVMENLKKNCCSQIVVAAAILFKCLLQLARLPINYHAVYHTLNVLCI